MKSTMQPNSRGFMLIGGFPKDSTVNFIEIPSFGESIFHYKDGTTEATKTYNIDICERFVTQGRWEEIKNETV